MTNLNSKFRGSMAGTGLGDAIGELAFGSPSKENLQKIIDQSDLLRYTDDTAMAIGLAESLAAQEGLDRQHLGDTFKANYQREPWRGYAMGPPTIFRQVERTGQPYTEVAQSMFGGEGSFGNGAAMRIAPVGLFFYDSPDLDQQARASARVTHAHPIGQDGAAILALAVAQAVKLDPAAEFPRDLFCQALIDVAQTPELRQKMSQVKRLVSSDAAPGQAANQLGRSVAMHQSMPFAVYAFVRHPDSFTACLWCAILNGGDRDTLGAMAGAVSGAYLGVEAIPAEWREKLENREKIEGLAGRLAELASG